MIDLTSVEDGFSAILCSYTIKFAALVTLLAVIRPPSYADVAREQAAKEIYWTLAAEHTILFFAQIYSLYCGDLYIFSYIFVMIAVFISCYLCGVWIFAERDEMEVAELTP